MNGRTRLLLALVGLAGLLVLAGCLSPVSDADLAENATYDWDSDANASYRLYGGNYTAVIEIRDRESLKLSLPDGLGSQRALAISALQFRYPNGTVANDSVYEVSAGQSRVAIEPPVPNGTVAFTAERTGADFRAPVLVGGSHEIGLPPNQRVGLPAVSRVVPGGYGTEQEGDRVVLTWDSIDRDVITIQTYLERDLLLMGGLIAIVLTIGAAGLAYYRREIAKLRAQREALGLDVDQDEDDPRDRGPPPGMG